MAEVVEDTAAAAADRPDVGENIMNRIKKALALGLHCGGNDAEKKHAMQRATRLMQQYGLSQAGAPSPLDPLPPHRQSPVCLGSLPTFSPTPPALGRERRPR